MMKKIAVILSLILIFFISIILIFYPNIRRKKQINNLTKEIQMCSKYLFNDNIEISKIRDFIKKTITSDSKLVILENEVDLLLTDLLDNYEQVKTLVKTEDYNNVLTVTKDNLDYKNEYLNKSLSKLEIIKNNILNIDINNYITTKDKYIYPLLKEKIDFDKLINNIDEIIQKLNEEKEIISFLSNNVDYWNNDDSIVFTKRSVYDDFVDIVTDKNIELNYKLVDDKEGPLITANNIIITQDDNINIYDYISCEDEVDGVVECKVTGDYNKSNVGSYPIDITAKDKSDNSSYKTINVIVKEKEKYEKPYVIEVIRNQSTIIVYGRDENGEYSNIVGVFPCSPGAGENTPLGTFYTKRGSVWGGLFGNVFGQYTTVISGHVLFHSVPYYSMSKDSLIWEYYNNLGTKVSMGCIRLTVRDAKWIYDNCGSGTMVKIYDGELPDGVSKPEAQKIDGNDERRGWDPTDPDPANPWNQ